MSFSYCNIISLIRGPLAFLFLFENTFCRALAVLGALMTDILDGYLARRLGQTSQLGAMIDPLMDKFFVFFVVGVLIHEDRLQLWQALSLISRDFAVLFFGCYLALRGAWSNFQFQSIWCGKITTSLQFIVFFGLLFQYQIPNVVFYSFITLGFFALIELYFIKKMKESSLQPNK